VMIMLVSFLPVFALSGIDGKMYRPLAFTKTFALLSVAILAVTLVPALCTIFIKGRIRRETESWIVRSVIDVYRPVLNYLLDHPGPLLWVLGMTLVLGAIPLGDRRILLPLLGTALVMTGWTMRTAVGRALGMSSLLLVALLAEQQIRPLDVEMRMPLDEGMVMDMPITVPRASSVQAGDDLMARDMLLCRFPEVEMVLGKAGRVESPFDPAPLDMIETMVMFRPREFWPRRKLTADAARRQERAVYEALMQAKLVAPPESREAAADLLDAAHVETLQRYDAVMREFVFQKNEEFSRQLHIELAHFLVRRTVTLLEQQGKLLKHMTPGDVALVTSSAAAHASEHLAMSLQSEDVSEIARHAADALRARGFLADDPQVLEYRPGWLARPALALGQWLGAPRPVLLADLEQSARKERDQLWSGHIRRLNDEILDRAARTFTRIAGEEILKRAEVTDPRLAEIAKQVARAREGSATPPASAASPERKPAEGGAGHHHHHSSSHGPLPVIDPHPVLDTLCADLSRSFSSRLMLWPCEREGMTAYGGEMDTALKMPGWGNVWTMPIQNRVDMLNTGVNTEIGVRVLGRRQEDVADVCDRIAAVLQTLPGAVSVVAEPLRGKGYVEIRPDREKAALYGVQIGDINDLVETAIGGKVATTTVEGREHHALRVRYQRDSSRDEEAIRRLPVPVRELAERSRDLAAVVSMPPGAASDTPLLRPRPAGFVPLEDVASVKIVEGPATIKSENGLLRNYVKLNVRDRGVLEFVEAARRAVAEQVELPEGTYVEWTGQFEHAVATGRTLLFVIPIVIASIFLFLYLTYHDWADACLMLLAVPGTFAGGVLFQWLFDFKFSVAVGVGYIACFGMAAATGMIMLVYLREAVDKSGGLERMSLAQLRQAVMDGAVHRLRPKLLTEGTMILGLAPMLWASGAGAEVIRPMAAPVLGGILIADEVIDLLLPVLFYHIRRRRWLALQPAPSADDQ
ncbi:MAG: efflux RND transporter permease subunit, partial [Deltaproteobacteria bacterium]